ncbi:Glutamyl-tRNA(Gln) amidotransferase subunit A [Camellia lanceoleosa]|uniref:Glutamyl-tRNA(Gln) amidotransferase subunit A n=1 Tax=Camellia lanceoleosa TaxID=1840588 RepID=A0ACC0FAC9_9ERIC|nr:Glutamyl-tRNA(Gln) amidotransferase subunit A [Camellia lanceoleosa]
MFEDSEKFESKNNTECSLTNMFKLLEAGFFNYTEMLEIIKGVKEFNQPIIKSNRKLVASTNGGLHNPSCLVFNPHWGNDQAQDLRKKLNIPSLFGVQRPKSEEDIAFMTVLELGQLIKTKQITSEELTGIFLKRLKRYNPVLEAVVTYTEELAYKQAKEADELLAKGVYLGPLHGIPYGLKDIIAVPHYKTTWGSRSFKNQVLNIEAWVYKRAILVAKLVTDHWHMMISGLGEQGTRGILRNIPRVHLGFFTAPRQDPDDLSSRNISLDDPFSVDIAKLTVGYLDDAEMEVVHVLRSKGVNMVPFKLNYSVDSVQGIMNFTMDVDMLSHFDEWQRSRQDDNYEAQDQWPVELRHARMVPAVDYLQAQRARGKLIREVKESFTVGAFVGNATDWEKVCMGNLVGMPVIVVPTGFKMISDPPPSNHTRRRTTITTGVYSPPEHDHIGEKDLLIQVSIDFKSSAAPIGVWLKLKSTIAKDSTVPIASLQTNDSSPFINQMRLNESQRTSNLPPKQEVPTLIIWNYGGNDITVEGSWDN